MPGDTTNNDHDDGAQSGKVIDLQGHQAAEQLLDDLLRADRRNPAYHSLTARAVAVGPPMLAAIVRRLDSSRPRRIAALGRLASTYPSRGEAVKALVRAAADRRNNDNRRFGALLVLTQYLGMPPVDDFMSTLRNPAMAVAGALVGALTEPVGEAELQHEFTAALLGQSVDVLYAVLQALQDVPGDGAVAALRLLALQPEPELMQGAIEALSTRPSVSAIRSLAILEPNLPPETVRTVGRLLQKLRLSGYDADILTEPVQGCRARLGPVDGQGKRALWLQTPLGPGGGSIALGLDLSDMMGLMSCTVFPLDRAQDSAPTPLPAERPGSRRHANARALTASTMLDVPFAYGLRVLRDAVEKSWEGGTPLPVDYQLYFHYPWRFGNTVVAHDAPGHARQEYDLSLFESESELLSDPLFETWYLESGAVYLAAQELLAQDIGLPEELTDQSWRALLPVVIKLARSEFNIDMRDRYARRLRLMSEWLEYAGRGDEARLAASAAHTMLLSPPEANLFVLALVQKGILVAIENTLAGRDLPV